MMKLRNIDEVEVEQRWVWWVKKPDKKKGKDMQNRRGIWLVHHQERWGE